MKNINLGLKVRIALLEQAESRRYSEIVADNIRREALGKSEKEIIELIYNYVFNDTLTGQENENRTNNIVYGDEDFITDVLGAL